MGRRSTGAAGSLTLAVTAGLLALGCGGRTHPARDAAPDAPDSATDAGDGSSACGDCDDRIACTHDSCVAGTCTHEPDDAVCAAESPCRVPDCDVQAGCSAELLPDGTWCGAPGADGAPSPACHAGACVPQRVTGVYSWATLEVEASQTESEYGYYTLLARVTDRNGDGVDDVAAFVVGVSGLPDQPLPDSGVFLYAFPQGDTIWSLEAVDGESYLGWHLACPGDLDGDGATDLVFGLRAGGEQRIRAIDASDGHTLWEIPATLDSLRVLDDLDGDGASELGITEPFAGTPGALRILSSRTGDVHAEREGNAEVARFLGPVSVGDVDGDAVSDIAVELEAGDLRSSWMEVLSGADLRTIAGYDAEGVVWTWPSVRLGDLTGDGRAELGIDELHSDHTETFTAFDLSNASRIWTPEPGFWPSRRTYDLNADGEPDLTGNYFSSEERRHDPTWHSGRTGELLFTAFAIDESGLAVDLQSRGLQVPDVNADTAEDWLIPFHSDKHRLLVLASIVELRR